MTLEKTLDKWASTLSDKAAEKDTPLQESIDAFKAVTAYYAAKGKRARKADEDEPEEAGSFTFADSGEVVNGSRDQKVRARRNS
jgi:hypothetical protein